MDTLIGDVSGRRGCLYQPGASHDCQSVTTGVMTFPDDVIDRHSTEAQWVAVFPVGGARTQQHKSLLFLEQQNYNSDTQYLRLFWHKSHS